MKRFLLGLTLLMGFSACSDKVGYHYGFITQEVFGRLEPKEAFVLVERDDQTFLPTSEGGHRLRASAGLVRPNEKGVYRVYFPDETQGVSLLFVAKGYQSQRINFSRTLGVDAYEYDIVLQKSDDWKGLFFSSLRPYLSGFLTEPRYAMPENEQLFLGQWLNECEDQLQ